MKKKIAATIAGVVLLASALPVLAKGGPSGNANGPRGQSNKAVMQLIEKDETSGWPLVARDMGGAFGTVRYNLNGSVFNYEISAHKLVPNQAYQIEFEVDGTIYAVASVSTNSGGTLHHSDSITEWAEGICVGSFYNEPTFVAGHHDFKVWVKTDGNPTSGADGNGLTCSGDDSGVWDYTLFEYALGSFN